MKFVLEPSLEHMALVKIGISLWNQDDVRALISKLSYKDLLYGEKWERIEEKVMDKVPQLSLPQLLKEKVFGVIKPIGIQIFDWLSYVTWIEFDYVFDLDFFVYLQTQLCWTPQGTVDKKKTTEVIVRNKNLDVSKRYRLACDNCIEDDAVRLWKRLPEDVKDHHWNDYPVISFWSDNMRREGMGHVSYKDIFYQSAIQGSKAATEYFLQKLTAIESEETLVEAAKHVDHAEVLCFLLSHLNDEQQMEVFKFNTYKVLQFFLQWPWQSFFIEIASCMWDFLSNEDYYQTLIDITLKISNGYNDWNYSKLLREFWQKSPISLKNFITNEIGKNWLLMYMFHIKDKEIIRLILKDTSITVKEKLIYSSENSEISFICEFSILQNEWEFLDFFIRECFPSKAAMLKFKEESEKHMMHSYFAFHFVTKKYKWDEIFSLSDNSIFQYNERSLEEYESSSSERFHTLQ